jgi:hypothetical protein
MNNRKKHFLSLIALLILIFLAGGSDENETNQEAEIRVQLQEPEFIMSAAELDAAFEDNVIAAEQKYAGRVIQLHGYIEDFGQGFAPYIYIGEKNWLGYAINAECRFSESQVDVLADLSKHQFITVKGILGGRGIIAPELKGCVIVEGE